MIIDIGKLQNEIMNQYQQLGMVSIRNQIDRFIFPLRGRDISNHPFLLENVCNKLCEYFI